MKDWLRKTFEFSYGREAVRPIEGLRGFAVSLVFFVHYVILLEPMMESSTLTFKIAKNLWNIGKSGVDLFFILSGFLIYGILIEKERPIIRYLWRRAKRLYPTFIAVLALYIALSFAFPAKSKLPAGAWNAAAYVFENLLFLPGIFSIEPIIAVAWSLSYEVFFYIAVPLAIWALGLRRINPEMRALFFMALAILGFAFCVLFGGHIRLLMFFAGIMLYDLRKASMAEAPKTPGLAMLALAAAAMIAVFESGLPMWLHYAAIFILYFLLCRDAFTPGTASSRLFSFTPLRYFGNMSYSYFLIHGLAINAFASALPKFMPGVSEAAFWIMILPVFALTLIPAVLLFLLVERPLSLRPPA